MLLWLGLIKREQKKKKGAEILIKIAAFAIKSDSGESGAVPLSLFLGRGEVGKKVASGFLSFI